ncbi:MAG: hypothetical protein JO022_00790, partial [Acidobacteriaceae bacterium]|nr:hypothetical protein [Acidobacteriaceae bacterium]
MGSKTLAFHLLTLGAVCACAQMQDNQERTLSCNDRQHWNDRLVGHCEMREQTMSASGGQIQIDPGGNGGVTVKGWSRPDILMRARIETAALSDVDARGMVGQIRVASGAASMKAEGPANDHDHNWSVTYEIFVPHQTDIDAKAH